MTGLDELGGILRSLLGADRRPVVAYTGIFTIAKRLDVPPERAPEAVLSGLLDAVGGERTLLMPTYVSGFRDGVLDLDREPATTGMINECFRRRAGTRRTLSVFWPFSAAGPDADTLAALQPMDAWGDGSLFEWVERHDAHLLMLGVPWPMCSFLHRVEWLARVPYRYPKVFEGTVIREGRRAPLRERVFVRSLDPLAENEWPDLDARLAPHGMRSVPFGRGRVAEIGAQALVSALLPEVTTNPFAFVKAPEILRAALDSRATPPPGTGEGA